MRIMANATHLGLLGHLLLDGCRSCVLKPACFSGRSSEAGPSAVARYLDDVLLARRLLVERQQLLQLQHFSNQLLKPERGLKHDLHLSRVLDLELQRVFDDCERQRLLPLLAV